MLTLIQKYLDGVASPAEIEELELWIQEDKQNSKIFKEQIKLHYYSKKNIYKAFNKEIALQKIIQSIDKKRKKRDIKQWHKYAAIVIIIITSSILGKLMIFDRNVYKTKNLITEKNINAEDILLTLADGTVKVLGQQNLSSKSTYQEHSELSYQSAPVQDNSEVEYHTISIPRGRKFKLTLSDNTIVWLNAESKLKFPKVFNRNETTRIVFLEGEAFFEVTTDASQPFIVKTSGVDVKVLGTKFNVSSYFIDSMVKTTLVEGSVEISEVKKHENNIKLLPGHQASFNKKNRNLDTKKVDINQYISWLDNKLIFFNEKFENIIKRIERTYDVSIVNEYPEINTKKYTGEFDIETIEDIFRILSTSTSFNYTINQNQITIRKKN